jgi:general secretion pathway protein A
MEQSISQNILSQKSFQQALYTDYFGISENPFSLTPDPKYFYLSSKHKEALAHLYFGLKEKQGFIAITGEVGTGKTTLCRAFLEQIAPDYDVAYILNPCFTALELLENINREFGIPTSERQTKKELLERLNEFLLEKKRDNRTVIVIIDEAQNLEPEVLEQIRLISNLETTTEKLIQIVLIGQPELNQLLSSHNLRQLNQRILFRWHIDPLDFRETLLYIEHRLKIASIHNTIHFEPEALKTIYHHTGGIPRLINVISHRSMLVAYAHDRKIINKKIIDEAAQDINTHQVIIHKKSHVKKTLAAVIILLITLFLSISTLSRDTSPPLTDTVHNNAENKSETDSETTSETTSETDAEITPVAVVKPSQFELFESELKKMTEEESLTRAKANILSLWNSVIPSDAAELALYDFEGTLEELKKFNLPTVLEIMTDTGKRYISLERIEGDKAVVSVDEQYTLAFDKLESIYRGNATIYWKDHEKLSPYLSPGDRGIEVKWLQLNLKELGFMHNSATTVFDSDTVKAVTEFQQAHKLKTDGVVGPATKMILYSQLRSIYPSPQLIK